MKTKVILSIRGRQSYQDQEPEIIELVTQGEMEFRDGGWNISYEESELTGLAGVTTTFRAEPEKLTLLRTGPLQSEMVFQLGKSHDSLYRMPFGALLITVCATNLFYDITPDGGVIDLAYSISIEHSESGTIDYHLDIRLAE